MASTSVYEQFKSWLVGAFPSYTIVDFEQVEDGLANDGVEFIALEEVDSDEGVIAIGGIRPGMEEISSIDLHLFFPGTVGLKPARDLASEISDAGRLLTLSENRENAGRINRVKPPTPGIVNDGLWSSAIVEVSYSRQFRPDERTSP